MMPEEELDGYRQSGEKVRVIRDGIRENDVRGIVIAWDDEHVLIRRPNRNVAKLSRSYIIQPSKDPRIDPLEPSQAPESEQE